MGDLQAIVLYGYMALSTTGVCPRLITGSVAAVLYSVKDGVHPALILRNKTHQRPSKKGVRRGLYRKVSGKTEIYACNLD